MLIAIRTTGTPTRAGPEHPLAMKSLYVKAETVLATALLALGWFATGNWKRGRLTEEVRQTVRITDEAIEEGM